MKEGRWHDHQTLLRLLPCLLLAKNMKSTWRYHSDLAGKLEVAGEQAFYFTGKSCSFPHIPVSKPTSYPSVACAQ